jgi:hypothetical protein
LTTVIPLLALVLVLLFLFSSFSRNAEWSTDLGLWEYAVKKLPKKPGALESAEYPKKMFFFKFTAPSDIIRYAFSSKLSISHDHLGRPIRHPIPGS